MKKSLIEEVEHAEREADEVHKQRKQTQKRLNQLQAQLHSLKSEEKDHSADKVQFLFSFHTDFMTTSFAVAAIIRRSVGRKL